MTAIESDGRAGTWIRFTGLYLVHIRNNKVSLYKEKVYEGERELLGTIGRSSNFKLMAVFRQT